MMGNFVPIRAVKIALLLLLPIVAMTFSSCNTLANRRDMFVPDVHEGPYTKQLRGRE